jgi:hypothetical protein
MALDLDLEDLGVRRMIVVLTALILVAACNSSPLPTPSPVSSAAPTAATPMPPASPSATPAASATPPLVTEQMGHLTVTHPRTWRAVAGPSVVANRPVPLFYLSNAPLTVVPCHTPDTKTGVFEGCPDPISELPADGVLVTINPNLGILALNPPRVSVETASGSCRSIGGETQMSSVVWSTVVTACLRGPDIAASEAQVRGVISSLARPPD